MKLLAYLKSFLGNIAFLIVILFYGSFACISFPLCPVSQRKVYGSFLVISWSKMCLFLLGVHLELSGEENIQTGSIYLFNHKSQLDIPILCAALPIYFRFGAKKEFSKIPVLGWFSRIFGNLIIERDNRNQVLKLYQKSLPALKEGDSFALAPEGGRFVEEGIGSFRSGPFIFAINGGVPIVPVVISGADKALKKGSLFANWGVMSTSVKMKILPGIETQGYSVETRQELKSKVRNAMVDCYTKLNS